MENEKWTMPEWMMPYKPFIHNTGGNDIEQLYNDNKNHLRTNLPLAIIIYCVQSQVDLLIRLKKENLLKEE